MKPSKSSSVLATGSRWAAPLLIAGGAVIGVALTWAVLISMESFQKDLINQPAQVPVVENQVTDKTSDVLTDASSTVYEVTVDWYTKSVQVPQTEILSLLKDVSDADVLKTLLKRTSTGPVSDGNIEFETMVYETVIKSLWRQGDIHGGIFDGGSVYAFEMEEMMPVTVQFALSKDGKLLTVIDRKSAVTSERVNFSDYGFGSYGLKINSDPIKLSGTTVFPKLHYKGRTLNAEYSQEVLIDPVVASPSDDEEILMSDEGVQFRVGQYSGCVLGIYTGNYVVDYSFDLSDKGISDIEWAKYFSNKNGYTSQTSGGCGGNSCPRIVSKADVGPLSGLQVVGTVQSTGDVVYAPKDPSNHKLVKEAYDQWYTPSSEKKQSIQEMIDQMKVPLFFWKDAFGRWIQYGSTDLVPQAECGKPVIYLYPATSTQVSVKLPSFINVTVSDPQYSVNGWNVTANPNGDLVSRDDGKTYGSLYWEGTGVGYQVPKTGFIVKDGEVSSFLTKTLPKYGLNQKEMNEFMDFWVPRMVGAPYYQISFLTSEWSKVAPLNVTPRPQTSIRIFMDWKPLSRSKSIKAPTIVTPARNGFTLVEWGGLLYK